MQYKALVLDLDGTTVPSDPNGLPSPRVIEAIEKASHKLAVCVSTGRPLDMVGDIFKLLKLSGPCILGNGVQLYDPNQKKILSTTAINDENKAALFAVLTKYSKDIGFYDGEKVVRAVSSKIKPHVILNYWVSVKKIQVTKLETELEQIPHTMYHKIVSWTKGYMDFIITHADASKQHGVLQIAKHLGIETKDIIGVGDSYNDYPLLMACGLKIAMRNGVDETKAIADFICPSVSEDGVAVLIEKLILSA